MPPDSVYVGREVKDRRTGAVWFRESRWLLRQPDLMAALRVLRGEVLARWCAPDACHGDVLLVLANARP